jgi:hypothetical protein
LCLRDVDPKLTEIQITFSKEMHDHSWSWAQASKASLPKVDGKIKYLADKRNVRPPRQVGRRQDLVTSVNSQKFSNLKDAEDRPVVPNLLVFRTKALLARVIGASAE